MQAVDERAIRAAVDVLECSGLVAMPTETVYGLAANAEDEKAVKKIFEAKNRPTTHPLIVHITGEEALDHWAKEIPQSAYVLARRFWPGPLTMILKRTDNNAAIDLACSGLPNIAVRMPSHPVALELIKKSGVPIVAPSANKFKSVSPTTAQHVFDSLGNKVDMILDGGACTVGVESTIIDVTGKNIIILRAGGTAKEDLEKFLNEKVLLSDGSPDKPSAPGQLLKHYAPNHPLRINAATRQPGEFFIGFGKIADCDLNLSPTGDLREAAANLFAFLRQADAVPGYTGLAMSPIPENGLGLAINDRIRRASYKA